MTKDENRSIFRIMDKIMQEVDKTKTIFTILIVLIIIPLSVITLLFFVFDLSGTDYYSEDGNFEDGHYEEYPDDFIYEWYLDMIFSLVIAVVIAFAIRQLLILNKWTKKYQEFKNEQDEMDKKLDEDLDKT